MNRKVKLALDIIMGAVIPILILNNLNEQLGTVSTYIVAALVPVAWVLLDAGFITRRFNFIASYVGAFAILRGLLAFWFVDGIQFALKDTIGTVFTVIVFGVSILIDRPIMHYFLMQGMNPDSPHQKRLLKALLAEPKVYWALVKGTKIILMINLLIGIINFFLNLQIVVADFGTTAFNQQVAQVNAITQVAFTLLEFIGAGIVAVFIRRAMFFYLPKESGKEQDESDFWDLLNLRERQQLAADS
ncbi:MAG: VC0807 family protein [Cyanobacteria bacterium P01_H01_bin.58]